MTDVFSKGDQVGIRLKASSRLALRISKPFRIVGFSEYRAGMIGTVSADSSDSL
jgi:hypothetical protein